MSDRERYVAEAVRAARLDAESRALSRRTPSDGEKDADTYAPTVADDVADRVDRARKYAEWRWDGFHSVPREVASL